MALYLKVIQGPDKGKKFKLANKLVIGRSKADISLQDTRMSARHARVEAEGDQLILVDNGSRNGIKVEGKRVAKVALKPGLIFQLGYTQFEVKSLESPVFGETNLNFSSPSKPPAMTWQDTLLTECSEALAKLSDKPDQLEAFLPMVQIHFERGYQTGDCWTLGYGPRRIGPHSLDLPLKEPEAPEICCEIIPGDRGPIYKTLYPEKVKLNGQALDSEVLRDGDTIAVGATVIRIELLNE